MKTIKEMLTLSRPLMPQIDDHEGFLSYLDAKGIDKEKIIIPNDDTSFQASQQDLDIDKVISIKEKGHNKPVIVSRDNKIMDGHHRWAGDVIAGRDTPAIKVDQNILDLLKTGHDFIKQVPINEEITHKELGPMMDSFVSFASDHLGIKSLPNIRFKNDEDNFNSFAAYNPHEKSIIISTKNRHPMDIFRSVAHELVHCKQDEDGRITDVTKEGEAGSDIENEANAMAGVIMRHCAKKWPDYFNKSSLVEEYEHEETKSTRRARIYQQLKEMAAGFGDTWNRPSDDPAEREWGTSSLDNLYRQNTPGQWQDGKFKEVELTGQSKKKKPQSPKQSRVADVSAGPIGPTGVSNLSSTNYSGSGHTGLSAGVSISNGMYSEEIIKTKTFSQIREEFARNGGYDK